MTQFFLKAKHWHLFVMLILLPFLAQVVFMIFMFSKINGDTSDAPEMIFYLIMPFLVISGVLFFLVAFLIFGWLWSLVVGLQSKIPESLQLNMTRFKILFFIPLIYTLLIPIGIGLVFYGSSSATSDFLHGVMETSMRAIFPLHMIALICISHTILCAAKSIVTAETQNESNFSDYVGDLFLIWFYPFGLWFIQPRVNAILENGENSIKHS